MSTTMSIYFKTNKNNFILIDEYCGCDPVFGSYKDHVPFERCALLTTEELREILSEIGEAKNALAKYIRDGNEMISHICSMNNDIEEKCESIFSVKEGNSEYEESIKALERVEALTMHFISVTESAAYMGPYIHNGIEALAPDGCIYAGIEAPHPNEEVSEEND